MKRHPPDSIGDRVADIRNTRRQLVVWLWRLPVIAAVAGGSYGIIRALRLHFGKALPDPTPSFTPIKPQRIAPPSAFKNIWDAIDFIASGLPAIAIRLPQPIPGSLTITGRHYAAFSRVCTHQGCLVNLTTDLEVLAVAFNYRSSYPALTCPCHLSVFLPSASGRAVSGPAVKPLPRLELDFREGALFATGLES